MKTRLGMFVVVLLAMAALIPMAAVAEPTRAMDAEISGVYLSGLMGPEGEYSVGEHTVSVNFTNNLGSLTMLENQQIFIVREAAI